MKPDLVRAIHEKRLIEFTYKSGNIRVAEPHDYGVRHGDERLFVFQLSGDSRTKAERGWKDLHVGWDWKPAYPGAAIRGIAR
jgi:hypothetical protein